MTTHLIEVSPNTKTGRNDSSISDDEAPGIQDGRRVTRDRRREIVPVDVGRTTIRLEGLQFSTPMISADEADPCLLRLISLEEAALAVDPPVRLGDTANLLRM